MLKASLIPIMIKKYKQKKENCLYNPKKEEKAL